MTRYDYGYTDEIMEYLDTVRCKHCVYYKIDESYNGLGSCEKIIDYNDVEYKIPYKGEAPKEYRNQILSWDYEGYASGAYVGEEFGCILFNRKPDERI